MKELELVLLKVASKSNPSSVAGAVTKFLESGHKVELLAVGAGATNQAIKAIAIASGWRGAAGACLSCRIGFTDVTIGEEVKTGMKFFLEEK